MNEETLFELVNEVKDLMDVLNLDLAMACTKVAEHYDYRLTEILYKKYKEYYP